MKNSRLLFIYPKTNAQWSVFACLRHEGGYLIKYLVLFSGSTPQRCTLLLATILMITLSGCSSTTNYRVNQSLPEKRASIKRVGLLPPNVIVAEERPHFNVIPNDIWSTAAVATVSDALPGVVADKGWTIVPLPNDDAELNSVEKLSSAVEYSIYRHAFGGADKASDPNVIPMEPFPQQMKALDYSLGSLDTLAERYQVDAFIMVHGLNLLPTTGVYVEKGVATFLSVLSIFGPNPIVPTSLQKVQIRIMIVDREGSVLYYKISDRNNDGRPIQSIDLRNPRVMHYYLSAALSEYEKGAKR